MPVDRLEQSGLNRAWITVDARLPVEWRFDGLTRVSDQTPESVARWRAWATRPTGERIEGEGDGPIAALNALARELAKLRGSASG